MFVQSWKRSEMEWIDYCINPQFNDLADICDRYDGLWSVEAGERLLNSMKWKV